MSAYKEVVSVDVLSQYIKEGKIDKSSAKGKKGDYYGLDYDINGRFCLCAIGSRHHMKVRGL